MSRYRDDFMLPQQTYLLSHSVGRPLKTVQSGFNQAFFEPWQTSAKEPWGNWLEVIEQFRQALATLFNTQTQLICPQVNLSSALTKILLSHPKCHGKIKILMSEQDFPSMGFAIQQTLPDAQIHYIPADKDVTDPQVWCEYLNQHIDVVFISHVYSNTGQCAPIHEVVAQAKPLGCLTIVDLAQSAGVIPIDLNKLQVDFAVGSCVKWLCGGPGAGYLWVNSDRITECQPMDVGWFSHENPFEFDLHHFKYHPSALRFWGGTPSVAPFAIATHSIKYFSQVGIETVRQHNQQLLDLLHQALPDIMVSPSHPQRRSGTAIMTTHDNPQLLQRLTKDGVSVDSRSAGIRVSPHIYNTEQDIQSLIDSVTQMLVTQ